MLFVFGSGFYGKISKHKKNWIETEFFHIMFIPLVPVKSMFVTSSDFRERSGLDLGLHRKSVIATYARLIIGAIAAWFIFTVYIFFVESYRIDYSSPGIYIRVLLCIAFTLTWLYFAFRYGKSSPEDIAMREKVHTVTGLYALPHWIDPYTLWSLLDRFEKRYKLLYEDSDWKQDLDKNTLDEERIKLIYGLALFNCMVHDIPENDELYSKADALYQPPISDK